MRKFKLAFCALICASLFGFQAQSQIWDMQYLQTYQLNDIVFSSANYGVAVGANGKVYYSSNGGYTWDESSSHATIETLNSLCYTDGGQTVYAVGSQGAIIVSYSAGVSWSSLNSGVTNALFAIDNVGDYRIAGGIATTILKSDNGNNWVPQSSEDPCHIADVCFSDLTTGFAVGNDGVIIKTTNSGQNWSGMNTGNITNHLTAVCFPTPEAGYVVGTGGLIIKTTNGFSQSYMNQNSGVSVDLYDVFFVNEMVGYIVGDAGTILKTTNGGETWLNISYGTRVYTAVYFIDTETGWVVGQDGIVLKTTTGGVNAVEDISHYGFSSYPNPVTDFYSIYNDQCSAFSASLMNLTGAILMKAGSDNGKCVFDMSRLPDGLYVVRIENENRIFYQKFVKE